MVRRSHTGSRKAESVKTFDSQDYLRSRWVTAGRAEPTRVRPIAIFTLRKPTRYVRFLSSIQSGEAPYQEMLFILEWWVRRCAIT